MRKNDFLNARVEINTNVEDGKSYDNIIVTIDNVVFPVKLLKYNSKFMYKLKKTLEEINNVK